MDLVKFYRLVKSGLDAVHFNFWKGWNSRMLLIRMNVKKTFKWRYVTILIVYIQFNFIDNTVYTVCMLSMPECNSCLCINTCINGTNYMYCNVPVIKVVPLIRLNTGDMTRIHFFPYHDSHFHDQNSFITWLTGSWFMHYNLLHYSL